MTRRTLALFASAALLSGCGDSTAVSDLNNVSAETIKGGLTTASAQLLVTGLLNQYRNSATGTWFIFPETMARDALRIDKAESRFLSEIIGSTAPDYSAFTGGGAFTGFFVGIRSANTLIDAAKGATAASGMSTAELSSLVGLGQTIKALNYWNVMETRDSIGMPIALNQPITAPPAPWCDKPSVLAYISALLDSGSTALLAGSAVFPVTLPSGYTAVAGTPAGFNAFNRGLKGKVEFYRGISRQGGTGATGYNAAVTALGQSFLSTTAAMTLGVFENYSTASGETQNPRVDAALHLNSVVNDSVQAGDTRSAKIVKALAPYSITISGTVVSTQYDFAQSLGAASLTAPIPILKNEELLLLRAQAQIERGQLALATADINTVRTSYGLAAYAPPFATAAAARTAVLYEKRYSLLMEGAQRLVDLRAYGTLNATSFKPGPNSPFAGDIFTQALPIPLNEVSARGGSVTAAACP